MSDMTRFTIGHGDLTLERVGPVPEKLKGTPTELVLAKGDSTPHAHVVDGVEVDLSEVDEDEMPRVDGARRVVIQKGASLRVIGDPTRHTAIVFGEKNGDIEVPEGTYDVFGQREYDPEAERAALD